MSYIPFIGGAKAVGYAKAKLMAKQSETKMREKVLIFQNIWQVVEWQAIGAVAAKLGPIGAIIGGVLMGIMAAKAVY